MDKHKATHNLISKIHPKCPHLYCQRQPRLDAAKPSTHREGASSYLKAACSFNDADVHFEDNKDVKTEFGIGPNGISDSPPRTGKQLLEHWNHIKTAFVPVYAKFILIKSGEHATYDRDFDELQYHCLSAQKIQSCKFQKGH